MDTNSGGPIYYFENTQSGQQRNAAWDATERYESLAEFQSTGKTVQHRQIAAVVGNCARKGDPVLRKNGISGRNATRRWESAHRLVGLARTWIGLARKSIGLARTWIGLARMWIGLARTWIGLARTWIGLARTWIGLARTFSNVCLQKYKFCISII